MPFCFLVQNFADIGQSVSEIWPKKRFSRWRPPPSWILKISIFGHMTVTGFNIWCSAPDFIKIGQFFTEIWRFNDFQNGGRPPSWILKICSICHLALVDMPFCFSYKISLKSDNRSMSYCQKSDFQDGGRVTLSREVQNNHSYEFFDPYLPIHYATFMRLRWRIRGVLRGASPLLGENFQSRQKWSPKWH